MAHPPESPNPALDVGPGVPDATSGVPSKSKSLAANAAGSTIWNLVSQVLQTLLGFGTAALLTKWLLPDDYGVFAMAATVVGFAGIFGDGGLISTLVRRPHLEPECETTGFVTALIGGCSLSLLSLAAAPVLGLYFKRHDVGTMAAVVALNFILLAPGRVSYAILARRLQFGRLSLIGLVGAALANASAVIAAMAGAGGWSLALSFLMAPALLTVMYLVAGRPILRFRLFSKPLARELSLFGAKLSGFALAVAIAWLPGTMILGRVAGATAVGLYAMGMRLVSYPAARVAGSFAGVFLSAISQVAPGDRRRIYRLTLTMLAMSTTPLVCGTFAVADELVKVLPASWSELAPTLKTFAIGAVFESYGAMPINLMTANGHSNTVFRLGIATIPLAWCAFSIAMYFGGLSSFVWAWTGLNIVGCLIFFAAAAESAREWVLDLAALARPLLASVLMAAGVRWVLQFTNLAGTAKGLPVGILAGLLFYGLFALVLLREDMRRGIRLVRAAARRRLG